MFSQRNVIRIGCGLLALSGIACALAPGFFASLAGISASAAGLTELRAIYAGTQLALAGFLFWCEREPALHTAGLVALFFFLCDLAVMRGIGLVVDGELAAYQLQNLAVEVVAAATVGFALLRGRVQAPSVA